MSGLEVLLVVLSVFTGATVQRITGLGFALVASPILVLVLGPFDGVVLSNILVPVNCVVIFLSVSGHRAVQWRKVLELTIPALIAIWLGGKVAQALPEPVLLVIVGSLLITGLLSAKYNRRSHIFKKGRIGTVIAGALSGLMNVLAGVGGPALVLYKISTSWAQSTFVPTAQIYFLLINVGSLAAKGGVPSYASEQLPLVFGSLFAGLYAGSRLKRRLSEKAVEVFVFNLALMSGCIVILKGVL